MLAELFVKKVNDLFPVTAERDVNKIIAPKIRPVEVECLYADVRYQFTCNMKQGMLKRWNILKIRNYLERNVKIVEVKQYKNDAHCIYSYLKSPYITVKDLEEVQKMLRKLG